MAVKVAIGGAAGRMGRRLLCLADADPDLTVVGALECAGSPALGKPVREIEPQAAGVDCTVETVLPAGTEVLIDFTTPEGTAALVPAAVEAGTALVIGTTGLDVAQAKLVAGAAATVPVLHAPNFSLGVNLVFRVAAEIARALGEDYNIEIAETHHNQKADAPSGTALRIAERICAATGRDAEKDLVHGRSGRPGKRTAREIGMHALRMGSVVGEHTVHYGSAVERIELTHRAETRDVFAAGALRAAKWIAGKEPGTYSMDDVLFG